MTELEDLKIQLNRAQAVLMAHQLFWLHYVLTPAYQKILLRLFMMYLRGIEICIISSQSRTLR
ncbi:MAG: hypothetical protein DU481_15255 [Nitrosomonas sp.]